MTLDLPSGFQSTHSPNTTSIHEGQTFSTKDAQHGRDWFNNAITIDVNLYKGLEKMPNDQKAVRWHLADIAADEYKAGKKPQTKAYKREIQKLPGIPTYERSAKRDSLDPNLVMEA